MFWLAFASSVVPQIIARFGTPIRFWASRLAMNARWLSSFLSVQYSMRGSRCNSCRYDSTLTCTSVSWPIATNEAAYEPKNEPGSSRMNFFSAPATSYSL
uniref:Putative secreted peptide n=1 Tax=Anopheles braziliensis TaxID=58242 RepID=A0A2M3ZUY1_9DIPT